MHAHVKELVVTHSLIGQSEDYSTYRQILEVYTKDGTLLATRDPCAPYEDSTGEWVFPEGEHPKIKGYAPVSFGKIPKE